eukprot:TRINITY_DN1701_c2_g2_i1.p1 TRINITY_DN1701_c2_g2~~TRINITY_DN1701_c2_g2_i1.p1  ORF type:complete len:287 (+),score=127.64 TRINITY_DN1701_c2_g2_i1:67-861(+)
MAGAAATPAAGGKRARRREHARKLARALPARRVLAVAPRSMVAKPLSELGVRMVVFDMAGTVVDEGGIVYSTLKTVMRSSGLTVDDAAFDAWHGANKKEVVAHFVKTNGKGNTDKIYAAFEKALEARYYAKDSPLKVIPGVFDLFARLRAGGIKVCLDTGFPRKIANYIIKRLEFTDHIDDSCVAMEVGHGRPYPYMIYELMRRNKIEQVSQVLKVGDTARDMEEGRYAGTPHVFGVLTGADDRKTLIKTGASAVLESVAEITV